jgi:pimeloyl-ACP methyl ester carboxylesterase
LLGRLIRSALTVALATSIGFVAPPPAVAAYPVAATTAEPAAEVVVLVHGLGRTRISMMALEWVLEREGYEVLNWGYSSTCCTIDELADELAEDLRRADVASRERVHFVGHSLGNIIVRSLLADGLAIPTGRVVMLAPPNQGAERANRFAPAIGWLLRPLPEITTTGRSVPRLLQLPPGVEVGVIAGRHDGKVRVSESHLPGESDHVTVPSAHTFIMLRSDVHRLVLDFLREGRFRRAGPETLPAHLPRAG